MAKADQLKIDEMQERVKADRFIVGDLFFLLEQLALP